ncbi:MAG: hypothetical protein JWM87_800, partial [Candidatus Eremiobacteraeota bacterium]|nr:hypothetical protein [Candidatus Eremiobacteraeota bacterium]
MEQVHGNLVQTDSIEPFNDFAPPGFLSLDRMLASNFIPPISFLFTRAAFEELGALYEAIPYVGDWDFLIRFLSKYEVFMIPQYLAFYHWRSRAQQSGVLGNTVTGEVDRHHFYRQLLLNQWLRADIASGRFGIGAYANLRAHIEKIVEQTEQRPTPPPAPAAAPPAVAVAAAEDVPNAGPAVPHDPAEAATTAVPDAPDEIPRDAAAEEPAPVATDNGVVEPAPSAANGSTASYRRVRRVLGRLRAWTATLSERKH